MAKRHAKYMQIKEHLLRGIASRRFRDSLPSENELAQKFGVSRMTARRALSDLELEGYALRIPGKGTFVQNRRSTQGFFRVRPFRKHAEEHHVTPRTRVLEVTVVEPPKEVAERLRCRQTILVRRLHYFEEEPVRFETRYLRSDLCADILWENLEFESIHEILIHKLNLPLTQVWQRLEAVGVPEEVASLFGVPSGSPAFRMERVTYTFEEPVTRVEYFMRGELYAFEDTFCPQLENV
ncbi:MAG: GntR family transcriptional regulator [Deltaproteobacteria bacterium]|nr:MAG: GntR family transcriptional regulator [Deltaproteobacteria bacterium]